MDGNSSKTCDQCDCKGACSATNDCRGDISCCKQIFSEERGVGFAWFLLLPLLLSWPLQSITLFFFFFWEMLLSNDGGADIKKVTAAVTPSFASAGRLPKNWINQSVCSRWCTSWSLHSSLCFSRRHLCRRKLRPEFSSQGQSPNSSWQGQKWQLQHILQQQWWDQATLDKNTDWS